MTYAEECQAALEEDIEYLRVILHDLHKGSPLFWEEEKTNDTRICEVD